MLLCCCIDVDSDEILTGLANFLGTENAKVVRVDWNKDGSNKGDGLTSGIKAFSVTYHLDDDSFKLETAHFMAKLSVASGTLGQWWEAMKLFERETEFYTKAMPRIKETLLKHLGSSPVVDVYHCRNGGAFIMMEDLKMQNFQLVHDLYPERRNALNVKEMNLVLSELARFHAASYDLVQNFPGGMDALAKEMPYVAEAGKLGMIPSKDEAVLKQNYDLYLDMTRNMVPLLRQHCHSKSVVDRFENSLPTLMDTSGKSQDPRGHSFVVIAHGDFWSNNVLFLYEDGEPVKVKIYDFQECMLSRPTTDLASLFFTSLTPAQRKIHSREYLDLYHKRLWEELTKLGYHDTSLYTREKLEEDFRTNIGPGFYWGIVNAWTAATKCGGLADVFTALDEDTSAEARSEKASVTFQAENLSDWAKRVIALVEEAAQFGLI